MPTIPAYLSPLVGLAEGRTYAGDPRERALVVPASIVAFSYVWSWVGYFAGETDWPLGWTGAARWLLVLALILIVSGWKEAEEPPTAPPTLERGPLA